MYLVINNYPAIKSYLAIKNVSTHTSNNFILVIIAKEVKVVKEMISCDVSSVLHFTFVFLPFAFVFV